jgi:hypothetical protein
MVNPIDHAVVERNAKQFLVGEVRPLWLWYLFFGLVEADVKCSTRAFPLLTQSGHSLRVALW